MVNSKAKGGRGEREFANFLKEKFNVSARRGIQFAGGADSPDVVTDIDGVHFEVKRTETLSLYKAMEQARNDCGDGVPVVAHRRSRRDWLLVIEAKDMAAFSNAIVNGINNEN